MLKYIAFLRAINVGGHVVKMDQLCELFESLGLINVETFIASGNVIFETRTKTAVSLERKIESALFKMFGYEVATFLRTDAEVASIARYTPFPDSEIKSGGSFNVGFLQKTLDKKSEKILIGFKTAIDKFYLNGREVYWLCRKKQSESTFSNVAFEKALGICSTFRGMNTMMRLAAKLNPKSP